MGHLLLWTMRGNRKRKKEGKEENEPKIRRLAGLEVAEDLPLIDILPVELLLYIFQLSHPFELVASLVCKQWRELWRYGPKMGFDNPVYTRASAKNLYEWCFGTYRDHQEERNVLNAEVKSIEEIENATLREYRLKDWNERHTAYQGILTDEKVRRHSLWKRIQPLQKRGKWISAVACGSVPILDHLQNRHFGLGKNHQSEWWEGTDKTSSGLPLLQKHQVPEEALLEAARLGYVHVLEWFMENAYVHFGYKVALVAAEAQQWTVLWFVSKHQLPCDTHATTEVARYNQLELLQALRKPPNRAAWDAGVCVWAVANGNDEMLRWAVENGCPCPSESRHTLD